MGIAITVAITLVIIMLINGIALNNLESSANFNRNKIFSNQVFTYATWAKWVETIAFLLFISVFLALVALSEDTYELIIYSLPASELVLILIYRAGACGKEKFILLGNEVIYSRGRFKKKVSTVNLNEIRHVEVRLFTFVVHMKSGQIIKIPACFTDLGLVYSILKYYRPQII